MTLNDLLYKSNEADVLYDYCKSLSLSDSDINSLLVEIDEEEDICMLDIIDIQHQHRNDDALTAAKHVEDIQIKLNKLDAVKTALKEKASY